MLADVLKRYAPIGLNVLKTSLQKVSVTGKTLSSLKFVLDLNGLRLQYIGRGYIPALETGRGPRKNSAYESFDKGLSEWLKAKGFAQKTSKSGTVYYKIGDQWFSAKSLAWKINKDGDKLWKQGRGEKVRDVYSNDLEAFVEELKDAIVKEQKKELKNKIVASLKAA